MVLSTEHAASSFKSGATQYMHFAGRAHHGSLTGLRTAHVWKLVLPLREEQYALSRAAAYCPELLEQLERATSVQVAERMLHILRPCLAIGSRKYEHAVETAPEEVAVACARELQAMAQEDAMATRMRGYLVEESSKLEQLHNLFCKLSDRSRQRGKSTNLMSAEKFA